MDEDPCFDLVARSYLSHSSAAQHIHLTDMPSLLQVLLLPREYKFYLSLENDLCTDYLTEKAWNALSLDTVPVVRLLPWLLILLLLLLLILLLHFILNSRCCPELPCPSCFLQEVWWTLSS